MVLGFSSKLTKKSTKRSHDNVFVVKDDSTTTTETTEMSERSNSPPAATMMNKQKKQSLTDTSLFKIEAAPVRMIPTTTTTTSSNKQTDTIGVMDHDDINNDTHKAEQVEDCRGDGGWKHSTYNDFEVPMNDDDDDNNNYHSNPVDMEVPVKDRRHKYSDKDGFPRDSIKYTNDEREKYGYNEDAETSTAAERPSSNNIYGDGDGDGDGAPDSDRAKYGYEDAAPDTRSGGLSSSDNMYGYGDGAPDSDRAKYGYEDAAPDTRSGGSSSSAFRRMPRRRRTCGDDNDDDASCCSTSSSVRSTRSTMRSSMKKHGVSRRRASITFGDEIMVNLPGQREPVVRRTSITFNESVKVKKVPAAKHLTSAPEKLWFQDGEFKAIRRRSLELVEKVEQGQTDGKRYCIRGLEKLMKSRRRRSMEYKYNAWDSVLDEQDVQRDSGTWDEEYMANIYSYVTSKPKEEAAVQGEKDYAEIENYMKSTRNLCRRLSM